jgi:hypothetical protein
MGYFLEMNVEEYFFYRCVFVIYFRMDMECGMKP